VSGVRELISRLEVLPEKEKKANHLGQMTAVRDKLYVSATNATELRRAAAALGRVKEAAFAGRASEALAGATSSAEKLRDRISGGAGFERGRVDAALTQINERLNGGTEAVAKGWRLLIDEKMKRYAPLTEAAERVPMPGAAGLRAALAELERWRETPPQTPQAADAFTAQADALPAAVANLGLEGPAGVFMIQASRGQARAKDLLTPEVRAFLDANPAIWSMLKVSL
jgi:hypothetical protein